MNLKNLPWRYEDGNVVDCTNTVVSVSGIAQPHGYVPPEDSSYDHGRLLAAAPDLLQACELAKKFLEPDLVEPGRTVFWNLVTAIRNAKGVA